MPSAISSPAPAAAAAGAKLANTPAPSIEPSPTATASPKPSRRASALPPDPHHPRIQTAIRNRIALVERSRPPFGTESRLAASYRRHSDPNGGLRVRENAAGPGPLEMGSGPAGTNYG